MRVRNLTVTALLVSLAQCAAAEVKNGFDLADSVVPAEEIFWGGVPRDGIPAIDNPRFVAAEDADFLEETDRVLGVAYNDVSKAYPIRILDRHEVVNDKFGGDAVVVTYCPLCFSGMVFQVRPRNVDLTFGVSGLLYNSDVLLYDRQTGSLWSQLMSEAISGPLKGAELPALPASHTTWREWRSRHPDTLVLSTDTGYRRDYRHPAYRDYQRSSGLMFPVNNRNGEYRNKELVLGIDIDGAYKAYPFVELGRQGRDTFRDSVGGRELTIEWSERDAFARALDGTGEEVPSVIVYWFAWYAFHPDTAIFRASADSGIAPR